jgi:hypothetical protein
MADNIFRRYAFSAEAFYLFNLSGTQAGSISENFIDSRFTFLICQYASSPVGLRSEIFRKFSRLRFGGGYS